MKISYSACIHARTLPEQMMYGILTTYEQRCDKGLIQYPELCKSEMIIKNILNRSVV